MCVYAIVVVAVIVPVLAVRLYWFNPHHSVISDVFLHIVGFVLFRS